MTVIQRFDIPDFIFEDGTTYDTTHICYEDINPSSSKVALIPTCFRGRIETTLKFADGALHDYRIITVGLFAGGESSSPSNTPTFSTMVDYKDCVRAQHILLTKGLNISKLDVVVGFSMAGQCAYYWLAMFPEIVRNAVIICSSAKTSGHNYQFLEGPKAALETAIDFAPDSRGPDFSRGLRAFGKAYSAWLTSAEWFEQQLFKELGFDSQESWDLAVTETGYQSWHPDDLLTLLHMWQRGDVSSCMVGSQGRVEQALSQIRSRVLLLPCQTDQYFQWKASAREAAALPNAELFVIPSVWGHLAGSGSSVRDVQVMDEQISRFLDLA